MKYPALLTLSRREFIACSSTAFAGLALLGCGLNSSLTDPLTSPLTVNIADHPELATVGGAVKIWAGPKTPVGVARTSLATFDAVSLTCPHQGTIVNVGTGSAPFGCPGHGAEFDINGTWVGGQSTGNLTRYSVAFDATAGTLTIQP